MKWIIWTFFKNSFTPTLFLCLKMVLQFAPRLKNNAFEMRVHFEWLLLWIHKKICLQKSQGVHVMFYRALTGQGQQSCSQVWILTVKYGCSDMAWLGVLVCCCRLHWHCTWMEAKCQGRREDISVPLAPTFTGLFGRRERVELSGTWEVAIEDFLWRRECHWDMVIEHWLL